MLTWFWRSGKRAWRALRHGVLRRGVLRRGVLRRLVPGRAGPSYATWLNAQRLTAEDRRQIAAHMAAWPAPPLISVLLPVYNSRPAWLRACLDSVLAQLYPHWELCIADDASTDPQVRAILEEYAARDPRLKVIYRPQNGHVAAATNSALALATGEFVAFLDHDDLLAEHALAWGAAAILDHPAAALIYSDADRCDERGRRFNPTFKPDWSPDLLLAHNYINHLVVMRTELVRAVGGLRAGLEGAQDHDLLLRVSERIPVEAIHHLPYVLYHWRAHPASLGRAESTRAATGVASHQALADCLSRRGSAAEVVATPAHPFLSRVRYLLPDSPPLVSIVIPTRDRLELLRRCIEGLRQSTDYPALELLIVDNDSQAPETLAYLQELSQQPNTRVLRQAGAFNYAALNNAGVSQARGEVLCFLNNDVVLTQPDWLKELVSQALRPEIGAVGPLLRYPDGRVQQAGILLGTDVIGRLALHQRRGEAAPSAFELRQVRNVAALTGACLVLRRKLFEQVGGFDEQLAIAYNDIDLCLKLRAAGYWLLFTPFAELVHLGSASRGAENSPERQARLQREAEALRAKWGAFATSDPFTNPNLTWRRGRPELAFPPAAPDFWRRSTL